MAAPAVIVALDVHDNFDRGAYPENLNGSTSTSGHTWTADAELYIDDATGDSAVHSTSGPGVFFVGEGWINHGVSDLIIAGSLDDRDLNSHMMIFRRVDANNYNYAFFLTSTQIDIHTVVGGVDTIIDSIDSPDGFGNYFEIRMNGENVQFFNYAGHINDNSIVFDQLGPRLELTIPANSGGTSHGIGSGEPDIGVTPVWEDFGYRAIPANAQIESWSKIVRVGTYRTDL